MKVDYLITACYIGPGSNGGLVIVNTFDTVISNEFPFKFMAFGLTIKLIADRRDYGRECEGKVVIRKEGRPENIFSMPVLFHFKPKRKGGLESYVTINIPVPQLTFETPGMCVIEYSTKNEVIYSAKIEARQQEQDKPKGKKVKKTARKK
jgi:hypothetical protein